MILSSLYVVTAAIGLMAVTSAVLTAIHHPWHTDTVSDEPRSNREKDYYEDAYRTTPCGSAALQDEEYVRMDRAHAVKAGIPQAIGRLLD